MKTAFQGELNLMNNYYEGPPQQSPRLSALDAGATGFSLNEIFKVATFATSFDHSLFGITNARAAMATSYFIGLGSFIGFIILIALIRIIYFAAKKRNSRSEYTNPNSQRFVVRSSDDIVSNNFGSDKFPAISNRAKV
ncbi:hypothetical protein [Cryptosporidium parvum Iowa II]|uniref:Uncharacterized protein n=2 Tax=Cryptosporidium parvum TaxID=5807 RepID=Q5CSA6_CRYPI|nr:hypothetical protein [Cryptosporidium parvum Iowa II]EAK88308.1 conserved hypothetical protein [Cryptosporidium parvum Iowa II]WKS76256.1 hypothetical protein CPCDC_1g3490 [Cryptosporidium sp. 43IA8]WRK30747.1 Uncharacterized protein cpbgf_1003490 [Cryptosporidium parvum]